MRLNGILMPAALLVIACGSSLVSISSVAADTHPGEVVFERWCAPCHGAGPGIDGSPMLPGTAALERLYQGNLPAELAQRKDLTVEAVTYVVRNGRGAMPSFRKTELSDRDIELLVDWIRHSPL